MKIQNLRIRIMKTMILICVIVGIIGIAWAEDYVIENKNGKPVAYVRKNIDPPPTAGWSYDSGYTVVDPQNKVISYIKPEEEMQPVRIPTHQSSSNNPPAMFRVEGSSDNPPPMFRTD